MIELTEPRPLDVEAKELLDAIYEHRIHEMPELATASDCGNWRCGICVPPFPPWKAEATVCRVSAKDTCPIACPCFTPRREQPLEGVP